MFLQTSFIAAICLWLKELYWITDYYAHGTVGHLLSKLLPSPQSGGGSGEWTVLLEHNSLVRKLYHSNKLFRLHSRNVANYLSARDIIALHYSESWQILTIFDLKFHSLCDKFDFKTSIERHKVTQRIYKYSVLVYVCMFNEMSAIKCEIYDQVT